ncbi:MAG: alpha/beta hydrolase, partial [Methylococcales bacterium]|nr:alpha/beta hydrolase [Methylococcales bacterium]
MKILIRRLSPCILFLMFFNGCAQQQTVNRLYPSWGEYIVLTSGDNRSRHLQIKEPEQSGSAEACILMVHGMNEHIGRYSEIADYFSDRYIVAGMDLTAHGLSNPVFAQVQKGLENETTNYDVSNAFVE